MKIATIRSNYVNGPWNAMKYRTTVQDETGKVLSVLYTDKLTQTFALLNGAVDSYKVEEDAV